MDSKSFSLYSTFRSKAATTATQNTNDILKNTKSILRCNAEFTKYLKKYTNATEICSFMDPKTLTYPKLKIDSKELIPINFKKTFTAKNDLIKDSGKSFFPFMAAKKFQDDDAYNFKNKFYKTLHVLSDGKKKKHNVISKEERRYNLFFADFFAKWKVNKQDFNYKIINNDKYSKMNYDERIIFHQNYKNFLNERLEKLKKGSNANKDKFLECTFPDSNGVNIELKLETMSLTFEKINEHNKENNKIEENKIEENKDNKPEENDKKDENEEAPEDKNKIHIPLPYVFLFFYGIDFFKNILLSSIIFTDNFQKAYFDEDKLHDFLKNESPNFSNNISFDDTFPNPKSAPKDFFSLSKQPRNVIKNKLLQKKTDDIIKSPSINNITDRSIKLVDVIHANPNLGKKKQNSSYRFRNFSDSEHEETTKLKKSISETAVSKEPYFNEYAFIWETPSATYKVVLKMPIISFKYESIRGKISTFCDKNLFTYMFKNNFVNWDYYCLNYFLSLKLFRKTILSNLSYANKVPSKFLSFELAEAKNRFRIKGSKVFLEYNHRIYSQLSDINESFLFFYTDDLNMNSIIDFHSYKVFINYDSLNPKKTWAFYLNFKQMKYLVDVNKYESLYTFLPKIIQTSFQDGELMMDFSVFEDFDAKILNYEKKELPLINAANVQQKENSDMILDIKLPYVTIDTYDGKINKSTSPSLSVQFLRSLYKLDTINWPKKIMEELKIEGGGKCSDKFITHCEGFKSSDEGNGLNFLQDNKLKKMKSKDLRLTIRRMSSKKFKL